MNLPIQFAGKEPDEGGRSLLIFLCGYLLGSFVTAICLYTFLTK